MEARTKRIFKFIFITLLVDLLAFTLILPLLPKILDYYADNDSSEAYKLYDKNVQILQSILGVPKNHNKVLLAGILGSWFSFLQFMSSPFFGALSDKFGRKPVLLIAMSGSVVSYILWYISSNNFAIFVLSRTIGGLCKANVGLTLAIVSDVSNDQTRGKGMAVVGSSFSLAFIIGPLLGAYLSTMAMSDQLQTQLITYPSIIATALSILNLCIVLYYLEETNLARKPNQLISPSKSSPRTLKDTLHYINPKLLFNFSLVEQKTRRENVILRQTGLVYFFYLLFYSGLEFTLSFLTHLRFGFTSMQQGKLYLFSGILMALIQGGYIRRVKGGKEAKLACIGLIIIIPSFMLMGLANSVTQIYYSLILYSIASAVVVPCLSTIVSSCSPAGSSGVTMGTLRSIGSLARAIGPFVASLLFWTFGSTFCYLVGAIALILPLLIMRNLQSILNSDNKLSDLNADKISSKPFITKVNRLV